MCWGLNLTSAQAENLVDWLLPNIMPTLAEGIASIAIPTIEGYTFAPVELWQANSGYLGLAGNMVSGAQKSAMVSASAELASGGDVVTAMRVALGDGSVSSGEQVSFSVAGSGEENEATQTRYRLDDSAWSTWKLRDTVTLYRVIAGDHQLEVCARTELLVESSDCAVKAFSVGG